MAADCVTLEDWKLISFMFFRKFFKRIISTQNNQDSSDLNLPNTSCNKLPSKCTKYLSGHRMSIFTCENGFRIFNACDILSMEVTALN